MEHLVDANERASRGHEMSLAPYILWLGFDHDTTTTRIVAIEDYPLQRKWTREEICRLELGHVPASRTLEETLAMIQSWLFFGLLESAFGAEFKTRDYIRIVNGRTVVDTTELRAFLDQYHAYLGFNAGLAAQLQEEREAMVHSLRYASYWNAQLATSSGHGDPLASDPEIFTHVARLTTLVGEAVWSVGQQFPSDETRFFINCTWHLESGYERQLKRRVTDRGWCPALFESMKHFARLPASLFEYMSICPCLKVASNRHRDCQTRCLEYNVPDPETYRTTHRRKPCACSNVQFPIQIIADALKHPAVAVVDTDELLLNSNSGNVIKLCSDSSLMRYTTFSHVWSDGLGSDTERGLPTCQVAYLRELAMEATGTPYVWIDSLCIPRQTDLRRLAISRMSEAYRSSYATIVLDDGIRRCNTRDSSQAQLIAVALSTWQERLWTLSESVLSFRVFFAFEDKLKISKDILDVGLETPHIPVIRMGCTLLDNLTCGMFAGDVTVGAMQRNLCRRTSSWLDDESLAMAPLMGIDLALLLEVSGDERMMRFWTLAKHIPRSIIIESSPKFQVDGFRWAPRSLMNSTCYTMIDFKDESATVTEQGLRGHFLLYHLHFPENAIRWSRTLTFFESSRKYCLCVDAVDDTIQDPLLPGDVICFSAALTISLPSRGALLRPVRDRTGPLPRYRFRTAASANLHPIDKTVGADGFLGGLLAGAMRLMGPLLLRADEEYAEIVIC